MPRTLRLNTLVTAAYLVHQGRLYRTSEDGCTATQVFIHQIPAPCIRAGLDRALADVSLSPVRRGTRSAPIVLSAFSEALSLTQWALLTNGQAVVISSTLAHEGVASRMWVLDHPHAADAVRAYRAPADDPLDQMEAWLRLAGERPHPAVGASP